MVVSSHVARIKNFEIESLRGLAIILMVAGHVIGSDPERGMQVPETSAWRFFYVALEDIRMPLFTVLSGYVYAYRPLASLAKYPKMVKGKARRLLIPLLTVGTAVFLIQVFLPGTNTQPALSELWRIYFWGFEHLWFVQAIFLIFLLAGVLDALRILESRRNWWITFGLASVAFIVVVVPGDWNIFSVNGAIRLLPFFLVGYALHQFPPPNRAAFSIAVAVFTVAFTVRMFELTGNASGLSATGDKALSFFIGLTACTTLMLGRKYIYLPLLAWLGPFAFGIYLLHVFGSAGMRMALEGLGVHAPVVVFFACLITAIAVPIVFEVTFGKVGWISWAFLGQKPFVGHTSPLQRRDVLRDGGTRPLRVTSDIATDEELP